MQKTDFLFEICLGEDESNDGTREICKKYAEKYPNKIRLFLRSRKEVIYINGQATGRYNLIETIKKCKGKYIALCEGDDYWTDPYKLQKQVDFLEENPCYTGIVTNGLIKNDICNSLTRHINDNYQDIYRFKDILNGNPFLTSTVLYRRENFNLLEKYISNAIAGDYVIHLLALSRGPVRYINDVTAIYRIHEKGIWSSQTRENMLQSSVKNAGFINTLILKKYYHKKIFHNYILDLHFKIFKENLKKSEIAKAFRVFLIIKVIHNDSSYSIGYYINRILSTFKSKYLSIILLT